MDRAKLDFNLIFTSTKFPTDAIQNKTALCISCARPLKLFYILGPTQTRMALGLAFLMRVLGGLGNFATARLWDDGILDPAQTRMALGLAFSATLNVGLGNGRFGTFRM